MKDCDFRKSKCMLHVDTWSPAFAEISDTNFFITRNRKRANLKACYQHKHPHINNLPRYVEVPLSPKEPHVHLHLSVQVGHTNLGLKEYVILKWTRTKPPFCKHLPAAGAPPPAASAAAALSTSATRTIRVNCPNYTDVDSVANRFRRFGEVLHVSRDRCGILFE